MRKKIALIGAGNIGGTLAQLVSLKELGDVVLLDIFEGMPKGKSLDLAQSSSIEGFHADFKGTSSFRDIKNSDVETILGANAGVNGYVGTKSNTPFNIATNNVRIAHFTTGGSLGVGAQNDSQVNLSSVTRALTINGSGAVIMELAQGSTSKGNVYQDGTNMSMYNNANGTLAFGTNNAERMKISSDASSTEFLTTKISGSSTSTGSFGALSVPGQATIGSVVEASSIMYKENITPIDSPLEKITKLRGVEFDYKNTNEHSIGMIAEEVNDIFPELVAKDDKGDITAMSYTRMTAVLLEAVKELTEEVRELKAKNNYTKEKDKN